MKKFSLIVLALLALAAAPFVFADTQNLEAPEAAVDVQAEPLPEIVDATGELVLFADADAAFDAMVAEGWGCPHGAPSCSRDYQCDAYCGQVGWGACEAFCCACLG